jgi:hypothetical protein
MAAAQTHQSKKATPVRKDPPPRTYDGAITWNLVNKDPNRHYVWAHPDNDAGVNYYLARGYDFELDRGEAGVHLQGRARRNPFAKKLRTDTGESYITQMDMVLMSCPLEWIQDEQREAQHQADIIEKRMVSKKAVAELLRGINVRGRDGTPYIRVENMSASERSTLEQDVSAPSEGEE